MIVAASLNVTGIALRFTSVVDELYTSVYPNVVEVAGKVMTTWRLALVETFPAASFAQAYSVFVPSVAKEYETGALADQPEALARGAVADSVSIKPVTALLSEAVKLLIGITSDDEVSGMLKAVIVGFVTSIATGAYEQYIEYLYPAELDVPKVAGIPDDHVSGDEALPGVPAIHLRPGLF